MINQDFIKVVDICLKADLPIALYRLPGKDEIILLISRTGFQNISCSQLKNIEKAFVLHPFKESEDNPILYLKADTIISSVENYISNDILKEINNSELKQKSRHSVHLSEDIRKTDYLKRVKGIVDSISKGDMDKVVFSKTKTIEPFSKYKLRDLFFKMEQTYKDAFVYLVNIEGENLWCGATPELLLDSQKESLNTVALAGTQKFEGNDIDTVEWSCKDVEEQRFVCSHIEQEISNIGLPFVKSKPKTVKAGGVLHIKTEYNIEGGKECFWDLVEQLHPTPAVCGTPRDMSLNVIENVENYDRSYYSGYLGPIDVLSERKLFVNLRCAKWANQRLSLYVGGGVTAQSIPEKEWEETEFKADTLIKLL